MDFFRWFFWVGFLLPTPAAGVHLRSPAGQGPRGGLDQSGHPVRDAVAAAGRAGVLHQRHAEQVLRSESPAENQVFKDSGKAAN